MHWYHHRNPSRLLSQSTSEVRVNTAGAEERPIERERLLSDMLAYGCTRLEIGVQSVYEDVARDTNRCVLPAVLLLTDMLIS